MHHRKDTIFDLQMSGEPIYVLGVHFTYDPEVSEKKKIFEKLGSLKKTLNMWSQRDLSIVGRINIMKTLALSKLVFICSVMNTPKDFSKEVNKITIDFIWNDKPDKATREIKLTVFQYKIIHRILPTDSLLQKLKKSCLALLSLLSF